MYELSRVRLHSVGPPGARYQDVLLDFSDAGPVITSAAQEALFSAGVQLTSEEGRLPRRPSPASVLFLENGGGKSVLIKLIFSVMLPGRRQVVGTTNTRVLEKFVGAKDVAHVVLEWQHTLTGARIITGKVSEWRGHVVSNDPANLVDSWYCFRPTVDLRLDTLPLTSDGRLLTMSAFKEALDAHHKSTPELELFWTRRHHEWTERLGQVGLDTELFRYQRAMNAGEGEAADAFAFQTDDAFVEFLLRAVVDEQGPADLAEVVRTYSDNLGQRGELMLERDFIAGALDLLDPLAEEEALTVASRALAEQARVEAQALAAAVVARDRQESERLQVLADTVDELGTAERLAEGDQRRKAAVVTELRRIVAGMRLDSAQADSDRLAEAVTEARRTARAWRGTSTVLGHLSAARKADDIRRLVGNREQKARPALDAKNAAARSLARGLLALAESAGRDAAEAERAAGTARDSAEAAQQLRDAAMMTGAEQGARAEQLRGRIDEVRDSVKQAIRAGHLDDASDVPAAERATRDELARAESELARREAELEAVEADHAQAQAVSHGGQQQLATLRSQMTAAEAALAQARQRAEALAAEPRLAEVLGAESVELETDLPALLSRLADARAEIERAQTELWIAEAADDRALAALGSGGLLPSPPEVQAALDALERAGITAWSGLRYLSTLDPQRRSVVLERFPHLVSGVLVNDPNRIERAREVLTQARLLPDAALAVGCTQALSAGPEDKAPGVDFVVPPNPALYDEQSADAERAAIAARQAERRQQLGSFARQAKSDAALEWTLRAWREEYPPGTAARLAELAEQARADYEAADAEATRAQETVDRLSARRAELRARIPELRVRVQRAGERARVLGELAVAVARIPRWTDEAGAAEEIVRRANEEAAGAEAAAARWRQVAAEEQRRADGHLRTVSSARAELAEVPGGGSVTTDLPVPVEPVEVLRRTFAAAAEAYTKVEVGNDLRAELDHAEHAEATARASLESLDPDVRMLATKFLDTPDGADAASREAAEQRAERALSSAEAERAEAIGVLATRRAELESLPAAPSVLDAFERPSSVGYGIELIAQASEEASASAREAERLRGRRADAEAVLAQATASSTGFSMLAESLAHLLGPGGADAAEPYADDIDTARARHSALTSALATAEQAVAEAEKKVRAKADALVQFAAEKRFEKLASPVRRQIISVRRDQLPEHAAQWSASLRPRLRTLTGDLEQIDRHRSGIVIRLQGLVEGALRVLRAAQRLSRLPDGLGDWSGTEFLRIRFAEPDEALLPDQLGAVVDEAASGRSGDGRELKGDGLSLLLRAVRAAVPKGFRIDMLKPDSVLRTERQRVSEIRDVFSGGQQLTAAIILYCTMAALRANDKGRLRDRHSGVLFLDNPIGRASAGYLLELQRAVAEALGVQLIYTTGLFDAGALSEFPLIVRLRNDADLRAGRKYLSVDATIRTALDELGDPDGVARLSSTRVYEKTAAAPAGDGSGAEG